jgi:putative DNA primase/helicase
MQKDWTNAPGFVGMFDQALATMRNCRLAGVGISLGHAGLAGIDLDDCITDAGTLTPLAAEALGYRETYAEVSPSGEGVHLLARPVDRTIKRDDLKVELYHHGRYFTVTGHKVDDAPDMVGDACRVIEHLVRLDAEMPRTSKNGPMPNSHTTSASASFFDNMNRVALQRLDAWVPSLHPTARKQATGAWRVSSRALGRDLEEDLSYHPKGIWDYGEETALTAVDAVLRYGAVPDAKAAAMWLCQRMAIEPAAMGWTSDPERHAGVGGARKAAPHNDWPDPVPLPRSLLPVEPFDYDMLPQTLGGWVRDVAERMQCPPDFVAVTIMTALATVAGRKIAVRPKTQDDWSVVPNAWGLCIGPPGVMKSPAQNEGLRPLRALAANAREAFDAARVEYDIKAAAAKARTDANKKIVAKRLAKGADAMIDDLLKPVSPDGEEPVLKRYITSNATYEALAVLMQENPNGLLVDRDEMLSLLDRLDEEGHADERGFYLSGWNGDGPYTVDRIGRGLDLHVPAVCISMIGGTQPARISQYLAQVKRGGRGNDGLIQRFGLMVWPDISPTWTNMDRSPDRESAKTATMTFERLDGMDWRAIGATRDRGVSGDEEGLPYLRLSTEAHDAFLAWRTGLEIRLRAGEMEPMIESHLAKYRKLVPGLALVIHLVDAERGQVSATAMQKALQWASYLETHAARVYASSRLAATDAAEAIVAKIRSGHLKKDGFSSRDVWRPGWSRLRDRDTATAALQLLVDYDWLGAGRIESNGRTATIYTANPKAAL